MRRVDPDLMLGWDVRRQGLGFALERADALAVSPPLMRSLGRTPGVQGVNERREDACSVREGVADLESQSLLDAFVTSLVNEDIFWRKP